MRVLRRLLPLLVLPLAMLACGLASTPWLRAFAPSVLAVPLFGAAILSVLVPIVGYGIGLRPLWLTIALDAVLFVFYELFVTLHAPGGFSQLYDGLVHGPAQLLSFALPLVSPRTLLVAPVALCWVSGAILGECLAREWRTVLPYFGLLVVLGLSYAATTRAVMSAASERRTDVLFGALFVLALLLMRAVGAWLARDGDAVAGSDESVWPTRGLIVGAMLAVVVAVLAAVVVETPAFTGPATGAARKPPVERTNRLTPMAFVAGLRPASASSRGRELFRVTTDRASSNYISLASVDHYNGDGWTFSRTFRPSGGLLPADTFAGLRPKGPEVDQAYRINAGALRGTSWLPTMYRARQVSGVAVDVDADSGMVVPDSPLHAGQTYAVRSTSAATNFARLKSGSMDDVDATDTQLPANATLDNALSTLVTTLQSETGVSPASPVAFLQAVAQDFRSRSALAATVPTPSSPSGATPATSTPATPSPSGSTAMLGAPQAQHAGSTGFADVLASIRQFKSATPEQFATLMCLVARAIHVPARIGTGFRIPLPHGDSELPAGSYRVMSAQAWSWVEIPVTGRGWLVLDPSPSTHATQLSQRSSAAPPPSPSPSPSRSALITHADTGKGHAVAPRSRVPHHRDATLHVVAIIVLILAVLLVLLAIVFLATRKRLRRRRRNSSPDPRRRLLGAWQESLDVLAEAGLPDLTNASTRQIVTTTNEHLGETPAAQIRYLGDAANEAIFRPSQPVADADADSAWQVQHVLRRAVREQLDWRARVRSGLRTQRRPRAAGARRAPLRGRARH